nr:peptidylprolyl isomerase [Novosphingobium marinum]
MLRRIDPLFQFLGAGAVLLLALGLTGPFGDDERTIRVDRETLEAYLAAGGGEALSTVAKAGGKVSLDSLTAEQRQLLVDRYVEEQALYREARDWGLDENDIAIRRRLGQTLRFALRPEAAQDPGDKVLHAFYRDNLDNYREVPAVSFEHVFFSSEKRGQEGALAAARAAGVRGIGDWRAAGDRFAYQRTYVNAGAAEVSSQLGEDFGRALGKLPVMPDGWQGPIASNDGYHLVRVMRRSKETLPPFDEIRAVVLDDWLRADRDAALEQAVGEIVSNYDAEIETGILEGGR